MGIFPSKEHWQNCYGTLLDNFLEIDAIIGDIISFYGIADHILHPVGEKAPFGATVEEKTRAWWHKLRLAYYTNVCLGRLECCKFGQNSDVASSATWKNDVLNINKSSWFSASGAGLTR